MAVPGRTTAFGEATAFSITPHPEQQFSVFVDINTFSIY
jgi:hypothetical protein